MNETDFAENNERIGRVSRFVRIPIVLGTLAGIGWFWVRATYCWQEDPLGPTGDLACDWLFLLPTALFVLAGGALLRSLFALRSFGRQAVESDPGEEFLFNVWIENKAKWLGFRYHARRGYELLERDGRAEVRSALRWAGFAAGLLTGFLLWYLFEVSPLVSLVIGAAVGVAFVMITRQSSRTKQPQNRPVSSGGGAPAPAGA